MANIASARKRARQNIVRAQRNRAHISRMRTLVREVDRAVAQKDHGLAVEKLKSAAPALQSCARRKIIHKNMAARKISRLNARVKSIAS